MKIVPAILLKILLGAVGALALAHYASAEISSFPQSFRIRDIVIDGVTIHVRVGGKGPAVVMLHGFGDTGDMWAPVAAVLVKNHTVVVPDLRGMGLSSHPADGYDKKTQARDIAQVMDNLHTDKADFVTHDIGNMVGYAFAAISRARDALGRDRCATAGNRTMGRYPPQPGFVAFQFPRT
jgi:hypothetical protein